MLRFAVIGAVDSGKTTFVNLYSKKRVEKYGRTQGISFIKGKIKDLELEFIDCPGHTVLSDSKKIGLAIADAIIYIVDCTKPDLTMLESLRAYKPILVVLNRWPQKISSLKDICSDPKTRNLLYSQLAKLIPLENVVPFLEQPDSAYTYMFPLNLKSSWGLKEFEKYLTSFWLKDLKVQDSSFLYQHTYPKKKYKLVGSNKNTHLNLNGLKYPLIKLMDHNPVDQTYTFKTTSSQGYPLYKLNCEVDSRVKLPQVETKISFDPELIDLFKKIKKFNLTYAVYADDPYKIKALEQTLDVLSGQKPILYENLTINQFLQLDLKNTVKCVWVENLDVDSKGALVSDSFYMVLDLIEAHLKDLLKKHRDKRLVELDQFCLGQIQREYVFKNLKKELVCGINLDHGILKKEMEFYLKDQNKILEAKVVSLQKLGKNLYKDRAGAKDLCVKFELSEPWDCELGPYFFYSKNSDSVIQSFEDEDDLVLRDLVRSIKLKLDLKN